MRSPLTTATIFSVLVSLAVLAPSYADASCCYVQETKNVQSGTYYTNLNLVSTEGYASGRYDISVTFPSQLVVDSPTSSVAGTSCKRNSLALNAQYDCSISGKESVPLQFRLVAATLSGEPSLEVKINNAQCTIAASTCPNPAAKNSGATDPNKVNTDGFLDLGALGKHDPKIFWPVLATIIITVLGVMLVAWRRRSVKESKTSEDEEAQMARGGNGAGWFGEKKPKVEGNAVPKGATKPNSGDAPKEQRTQRKGKSNKTSASATAPSPTRASKREAHGRSKSDDNLTDLEELRAQSRRERQAKKNATPSGSSEDMRESKSGSGSGSKQKKKPLVEL